MLSNRKGKFITLKESQRERERESLSLPCKKCDCAELQFNFNKLSCWETNDACACHYHHVIIEDVAFHKIFHAFILYSLSMLRSGNSHLRVKVFHEVRSGCELSWEKIMNNNRTKSKMVVWISPGPLCERAQAEEKGFDNLPRAIESGDLSVWQDMA